MASPRQRDRSVQRAVGLVAPIGDARFETVVRAALNWSRSKGLARIRVLRHIRLLDVAALTETPVDGFVVMRGISENMLNELARCGRPSVVINAKTPPLPMHSVDVDDLQVGRMAGEFFLSRGYRHLAYLGFDEQVVLERREGLAEVADQAGVPLHLSTLRTDPTRMPNWTQLVSGQWIRWWLKQLPLPIGVLAFNDEIGSQLLEAAADLGVKVPEQLAVLGVDNREVLCEIATPPLSSVDVDTAGQVHVALDRLIDLLNGRKVPRHTLLSPRRIVRRASTESYALEDDFVAEAMEFIDANVERDITAVDVAEQLGVSRSTLERIFRKAVGHSPAEQLRRARIGVAKDLLANTRADLPDIARRCGFSHASSFARAFKQTTGQSPSEYRRERANPGTQ